MVEYHQSYFFYLLNLYQAL